MRNKNLKIFLAALVITAGLLFAGAVLAQNYGVNEIGNGLDGSLGEANIDPRGIAGKIINFSLGFLGLIAVGIILFAGFKWMTSEGNEEKVSEAKKMLVAGLIGLAIILSSWGIATWLITKIGDTVSGGGGYGYGDGDTQSCGCGGVMSYSNGTWGACVGSDCGGCYGVGCGQTSCDGSSIVSGCQATEQMCGDGNYCNDSCVCVEVSEAGESCDSNTENSTCDADNNLCGEYLSCDPNSCLCAGSPVITGVSPQGGFCQNEQDKSCTSDADCSDTCNLSAPNGSAGNFVTISGKNFGSYQEGVSKVIFVGNGSEKEGRNPTEINSACLSFWRDDQIVIAVPASVSTGPIRVIASDGSADITNDSKGPSIPDFRANNIIRPGLCELTPIKGALSAQVAYYGVNLFAGQAYFGNYEQNVQGLTSVFTNAAGKAGTSTIPNINAGESGSFVKVALSGNYENSNYLSFTKEREVGEGPFISSFSPVSGNTGQYITIYGSGFGGARGLKKVFFGAVEAAYDFPEVCLNSTWKDNQITVKVPTGLEDGNYPIRIELDGGEIITTEAINPNVFYFDKNIELKTSLCKIDPIRGPAGTAVSLWGEYFGNSGSESSIKFNGASQNATSTITKDGRADKLESFVPQGAITGPVRVLKGGSYGNEMNFAVGNCSANSDCGSQVCCPDGTYKKGRCAASLSACYVDIPSSVYEWKFNTALGDGGDDDDDEPGDEEDSCSGLAKYLGACAIGSCPNVPGTCSPYAGGGKIYSSNCNTDCSSVPGCIAIGSGGGNSCVYDAISDKCLQKLEGGENNNCDLNKTIEYQLNGKTMSAAAYCNKNNHWEIVVPSSCPAGFTKGEGNKCFEASSSCSTCSGSLGCEEIGGVGRCASDKLCDAGFTCEPAEGSTAGKCVGTKASSCDCCCTIGESARDCCAYEKDGNTVQLECGGTCGSDAEDNGEGLGRCGGCASAGSDAAARDAACNCSGHEGQYCETNDNSAPNGYCTDCSSLSAASCLEHADVCCLDAKGTEDQSDDICHGGVGTVISSDPSSSDFGYCAYYSCSEADPNTCNSSAVKIGNYSKKESCDSSCANTDPCSAITDAAACLAELSGKCCVDGKDSSCRLGDKMSGGAPEDNGFCAYYSCSIPEGGDESSASCVASKEAGSGSYKTLSECGRFCPDPPSGAGLSCYGGAASSTCAISVCNYPGFACMTELGSLGSAATDCGSCCCQPVQNEGDVDSCASINPNFKCLADKGNCSGANRGLCCGCSSDNECGSPEAVGCGTDTCCEARPSIASTSPAHLSTGICRNAVIKISFDQLMDYNSLPNNLVLLEEKTYGEGICPGGSVALSSVNEIIAYENRGLLARVIDSVQSFFRRVVVALGLSSDTAIADKPDESKLYCSVPGTTYIENSGTASVISFAPKTLLSPSANYYLIVKGDEDLNSKTGVMSLKGIGLNGLGYFDSSDGPSGAYTEGELINFNDKNYKNSAIIKFATLSSESPMSGICAVDSVSLAPVSYLFKTGDNALASDEDDTPGSATFDSKADKDKVFSLSVLSSGGQSLKPVSGYSWDYNFNVIDDSIVGGNKLSATSSQFLAAAQSGVTDGETKLEASIDMSRFATGGSCNASANCACSDEACSENCCNYYLGGDGFKDSSDLFVFLCNNPWPQVGNDGIWSPWRDASGNCTIAGGDCSNYSYKFYYCRDAGNKGTIDDLPAIIDSPVIRGRENSLTCSSDRNIPCSSEGSLCGADRNGDGNKDGVCIWDVLKESYFFRESVPSDGEIISATDLMTSGQIRLDWRSNADQADSYKIYYLKSGKGDMLFKEIKAADACRLSGMINECSTIISGLTNGVNYVFKVSVVSASRAESGAANEKVAMPTDKTAPIIPSGLRAELISSSTIKISWTENSDDTVLYRLYRGLHSTAYSESYDSATKKAGQSLNSLSFAPSSFSSGDNYFALSAIDAGGNESGKSSEAVINISPALLSGIPEAPSKLRLEIVASSTVKATWLDEGSNVFYYRLYHGTSSGIFSDKHDSATKSGNVVNSLDIPMSHFNKASNYFSLSAVDAAGREGDKSPEVILKIPSVLLSQ